MTHFFNKLLTRRSELRKRDKTVKTVQRLISICIQHTLDKVMIGQAASSQRQEINIVFAFSQVVGLRGC